jgi:hypothetical protein
VSGEPRGFQLASRTAAQPGIDLREITRSPLGFAPYGCRSDRRYCGELIQTSRQAPAALLALELQLPKVSWDIACEPGQIEGRS